jgi:paraquat-inducible protein A
MGAIACPYCDLLHATSPHPPGGKARCIRCGGALFLPDPRGNETALAAAVAAMMAFAVANGAPLMSMSELGNVASTTLAGSAARMWAQGSEPTAVLVAICAIVAPAAYLLLMMTTLLALRRDPAPRWAGVAARWARAIHPWAMPEVMLLGTLVAYVKISELAHASPGLGMYATAAVATLIAAIGSSFNPASVWARIEWAR